MAYQRDLTPQRSAWSGINEGIETLGGGVDFFAKMRQQALENKRQKQIDDERRATMLRELMVRAAQAKTPEEREAYIKAAGGRITGSTAAYGDPLQKAQPGGTVSGEMLDDLDSFNEVMPGAQPQQPPIVPPQQITPSGVVPGPRGLPLPTAGMVPGPRGLPMMPPAQGRAAVEPPPFDPNQVPAPIANALSKDQERAQMLMNMGRPQQPSQDFEIAPVAEKPGEFLGNRVDYEIGGQQFTHDPRAAYDRERGQREEAMNRLDTSFNDERVPAEMAGIYSEMRPVIAGMPQPPDGERVLTFVAQRLSQMSAEDRERMRLQGQRERDARRLAERQEAARQRGLEFNRQEEIRQKNRLDLAKHTKPLSTPQKVDDKRQDVSAYSVEYTRWEKSNNVDKLNDAYDKFSEMQNAVRAYREKGDVISQRSALYQAARYISGPGVLTDQELQNTVQRTGGLAASALTKIQKGLDGSISKPEEAALGKFVDNANIALRNRAIAKVRNFDQRYHGKNYFSQQVPDEVRGARSSLMERFGISDGDVYPNKEAKETDDFLRNNGF